MLQPTLATRATHPAPRRLLAGAAATLAVLLLAAWAIPPMLDWGRFRTAIAAIAAARLGRPVVIGGEISLRLLPEAVLTAQDVTLADQGDGISVQVAALRLQVATLPLVAGRVVLRDLVLSAPVLRLPWAVPGGIGRSARPQVPHAFAARIENGTLRIGEAEITGISAAIHGGPGIGTVMEAIAPDTPLVSAFGAEGFAVAGGRSWRFTTALGAPDADGVSAVDLSVHGQGVVGNTGGTLQGTLADGVVQGRLRAGGPDLSLLLPASPLAWTADAPFVASAERIEANAVALSLGGAPADGALMLRLDAPARLDGRLHAAALDLNGWAALLGASFHAPPAGPAPLMRIDLSADTARLLDGQLTGLRATLVSDGATLGFDHAEAGLPGGAQLRAASARLTRSAAGHLALSGLASLSAPDARTTLAWLHGLAPSLIDAAPRDVLRQADLSGTLTLQAGSASVAALSGRVDGMAVSGGLAVLLGTRPRLDATLSFDQLKLDPWLPESWTGSSLAAFGQRFTRQDASLHIHAAHATLRGQTLDRLALDAATGAGGLRLDSAQASLDGVDVSLAGNAAADGRLTGVHLAAASPALEKTLPLLPASWRRLPGLWHGAGTLQLAADGPPDALALQLRADAADLVLEADSQRDTRTGTGEATLTLRHPGAPRLVNELGLLPALGLPPGLDAAVAWLDTGSLTLRAHLHSAPGHLVLRDFDLDAAALRLSGQLETDWSGPVPAMNGNLAFEQLALPATLPAIKQATQLAGWNTAVHVTARSVTVGLRPAAADMTADLATGGGDAAATAISATVAGGHAVAQLAADFSQPAFAGQVSLTGAQVTAPLSGWPIDLAAGTADVQAAFGLAGAAPDWRGLSGELHAALHGGRMSGFDLAQLTAAAAQHTRAGRAATQAALAQGDSPDLSGSLDAVISQGRLVLAPARLSSADGAVAVTGGADLGGGTVDVRVVLSPAVPDPPGFGMHLAGAWRGPKKTAK